MKKVVAVLMAMILAFGLVACGEKPANSTEAPVTTKAPDQTPANSTQSGDEKGYAPVSKTNVYISAGPSGGNNFMICATLAELVMKEIPDYTISAGISTGSQENILNMYGGDAQMGISMSDAAMYAYQAGREYTDLKANQFNYVIGGYDTIIHVFVKNGSDIQKFEDIKGHKVVVTKGTTSQYYLPILLEAYGFTDADINANTLSLADAVAAVQDGTADIGIHITSYPLAAITDLANSVDIRFISFDDEHIKWIHEHYAFFAEKTIPANTYKGQAADVKTIGTTNQMICRADLDENFVYNFVKIVCENAEYLGIAMPLAAKFNAVNSVDGAVIPIHPGAEKYYKECGALK